MLRLRPFHVPLIAITLVLMTGGISFQSHSSPPPSSFVLQTLPLSQNVSELTSEPEKILDAVLATLNPGKVAWLDVEIRQDMRGAGFEFRADSRLIRGPNHCARLETDLYAAGQPGRLLVISDGTVLARVLKLGDQPAQVTNLPLPASRPDVEDRALEDERERILCERGCGGPHALLKSLRATLKDLRVDTGLLVGQPVLRLHGSLDNNSTGIPGGRELPKPAQSCSIFLDARNLLPVRVEWWSASGFVLAVDFHDLRLNEPLTHEQCVKEFTFIPD